MRVFFYLTIRWCNSKSSTSFEFIGINAVMKIAVVENYTRTKVRSSYDKIFIERQFKWGVSMQERPIVLFVILLNFEEKKHKTDLLVLLF